MCVCVYSQARLGVLERGKREVLKSRRKAPRHTPILPVPYLWALACCQAKERRS